VRCPANISLLALLLLTIKRQPTHRWIKYAGNWNPAGSEPLSYRLQRWWLTRNLVRGFVTVNGHWPTQPPHIRTFMNPCLTESELAEARSAAESKVLTEPIRLLFVGRVEEAKGIGVVVEVAAELDKQGVRFSLDILGDGPARARYEGWSAAHGLTEIVHWHGWKARPKLISYYGSAHLLLAPSSTEGWPKTIGEGMAYGVVPLASDISTIPEALKKAGTGMALSRGNAAAYFKAITDYLSDRERWHRESRAAVSAARVFTYNHYLDEVRSLLGANGNI